MAGEIWRSTLQIGHESVAGTAVAGSRKLYGRNPVLTRARTPHFSDFMTGTRDNVRAMTAGATMVGGQLAMPISADEILELLLMGIKGNVSPSTPTGATLGRLWTFTPSNTLDTATLRWDDGANVWIGAGYRADTIGIAGNVNGENIVSAGLFGQSLVAGALTGGLSDRTPTFIEGWQTRLYLDAFGGTPGFTPITGTMINWSVNLRNQLGRKYTASNTQDASAITIGALQIEAQLMFEASATQTVTEFTNWDTPTKRLLRLEFISPAAEIEAGVNEVQSLVATSASSGTFTLSFRGQTTAPIAYTANAAAVQSALVALSTIGTGGVVCTGGALPGTPVVITFSGTAMAGYPQPLITADNTLLVGGTAVVTRTTPGYFGGRYVQVDIPGAWSAYDLSQSEAGTRTYALSFGYTYDPTNAFGIQVRCQTNRTSAW